MNEPSVKTVKGKTEVSETIDSKAVHLLDDGSKKKHGDVHNFYSYFQAMATYDSMKGNVKEPFILTRSGYTGIQKYAAMWTGDNESSYDDLLLQMIMVMSLGISGMPYTGCDLGGFMGYSDHELLCRYYEMALFFPLYRNHKVKGGNDQELFNLPHRYKQRIKSAIEMRMRFMEYIRDVADESSRTGHPVIRPLFYHFFRDRETLSIDDQYMVGSDVIYAPQVYRDRKTRELYVPEGEWFDFNTGKKVQECSWITSDERFPLYVRGNVFKRISK
jgi:alpha-glucosidase